MTPAHERAQLERLAFFSDAVFAIAMTLLVVEVRLPVQRFSEAELDQALADLVPHFFGYVISFVVIGRFWIAHHRLFGLLARSSDRLIWLNLLVLLTMAFMPFPTAVVSEYGSLPGAVRFYAAWLIVMGLSQRTLIQVALRRPGLVRDDVPDAECRYLKRGGWIPVIIGVTALAATWISSWAGLTVLVFGSPIVFRVLHRGDPRGLSTD